MVTVATPRELLVASLASIAGEIEFSSIKILESLTFSIKIDGDEWRDAKYIDYRSALLVEAIQKDILGIINDATGSCISFKDLDKYPDLIVKVEIKDGCIEYIVNGLKYVLAYAEGMTPVQRLKLAALALAMIACGTLPWAAAKMYSSYSDVEIAKYKEDPKLIESIAKVEKIASGNRRVSRVVIDHSGDKTTVSISGDEPMSVEDLKRYTEPEPLAERAESFYVDGSYVVLKYDFEGQQACLRMGKRNEWVSTSFLSGAEKKALKAMASKAIDEGKSQRADLQISVQVLNGEIVGAAVMGVGAKRPNSIPLSEALKTKQERKRQHQASLLKHVSPQSPK